MTEKKKKFRITPWEVTGKVGKEDYKRLTKEFGVSSMPILPKLFKDNLLFRRGIIFGHRDFDKIIEAVKNKKKFVMMTGLMPSGKFHFGHAIIVQQILFYQSLGAKLYIAVADIEAHNMREPNMRILGKIATEEYLTNYIAMGLSNKNCDFYFQSRRSKDGRKSNAYYSLAQTVARYVTFNEVKAIYGDISPAKLSSALLQISDMLHPQLPEFEGPINVVVPVGYDQDPHIKVARDIIQRIKFYRFLPLSSTYNIFLPGLKGGKMSSSDPTSFIALTDTPEEAANKIRKYAFSGGQPTIQEHRKNGGNPDVDVSYIWLKIMFEPDDNKLKQIHDDYKSGKLLTSELKEILIEKITKFLIEHQRKRKLAEKQVEKFILKD